MHSVKVLSSWGMRRKTGGTKVFVVATLGEVGTGFQISNRDKGLTCVFKEK